MTAVAEVPVTQSAGRRVSAASTRLRLRALGAMGHSDDRIARPLGLSRSVVTKIINRTTRTVTPALRADVIALYDAWWDKRPPENTPAERAAAALARNRARRRRWCTGMGLDDDDLDAPGYQPLCTWRPATGTGIADDDPLGKGGRDTHKPSKTAGAAQLAGTAAPAQTTAH